MSAPLLGVRFEETARLRPVALGVDLSGPLLAPYASVEAAPSGTGRTRLELTSGSTVLQGWYDAGRTGLAVTHAGRTRRYHSRRHGRVPDAVRARVDSLALTLTGTHLTLLTADGGTWTARARVDLAALLDTRDEGWLAGLGSGTDAPLRGFGQLGLRDLRLVTHADGTPYRDGDDLLLTATSAGPGFFDTAHTSLWALAGASGPAAGPPVLRHRADLFFRRPDRPGAFGDHATHLLRDGERWLVATSTWGDFHRRRPVRVTLAEVPAGIDPTTGRHLLSTRELPLPTDGLGSVAVWDPHLVRDEGQWLVGFVSARRYFRFHPAVATGPSLDTLRLRAADPAPREAEGTTLLRVDGEWLALVGNKDRRAWTVHDLDLAPRGVLDAPYPTNIAWPTLVADEHGWLLIAFDGTPYGGPLTGYGTHGDVVVLRQHPHR